MICHANEGKLNLLSDSSGNAKPLTVFVCNAVEVLRFQSISNDGESQNGDGVVCVFSRIINCKILIRCGGHRGLLLMIIFVGDVGNFVAADFTILAVFIRR